VSPGRLLAGAYPGAPTAAETRQKLRALIESGVSCIVNLMEENETAPDGSPMRRYEKTLAIKSITERENSKIVRT
jgi:hypothetical protein